MSRYPELAAKVDAFFTRVAERHGADMRCGSGCHHCCHVRLSITRVEADAIRGEVARWPAEQQQALTENARRTGDELRAGREARCAALSVDGRCLVYAARPIVCRSHGAPIRMRNEHSLPVIQACPENFAVRGPAAVDADCILDQTTLSAMVLAIDRDAGGDGTRVDLADVIAGC